MMNIFGVNPGRGDGLLVRKWCWYSKFYNHVILFFDSKNFNFVWLVTNFSTIGVILFIYHHWSCIFYINLSSIVLFLYLPGKNIKFQQFFRKVITIFLEKYVVDIMSAMNTFCKPYNRQHKSYKLYYRDNFNRDQLNSYLSHRIIDYFPRILKQ